MQKYTLGGLKLLYNVGIYNVGDDGALAQIVDIHVCLEYNQAQSLTIQISDSNR